MGVRGGVDSCSSGLNDGSQGSTTAQAVLLRVWPDITYSEDQRAKTVLTAELLRSYITLMFTKQ